MLYHITYMRAIWGQLSIYSHLYKLYIPSISIHIMNHTAYK